MSHVLLGMGSNIGNREKNLEDALNRLQNLSGLKIIKYSSLFETEPVGYLSQNNFYNIAVEIEYAKDPFSLLKEVKQVEIDMGRLIPSIHWGPRIIDIDILFFDKMIVRTRNLNIPHPELYTRRFVLEPLAEIAPQYLCPVTGLTVVEILKQCEDTKKVYMIAG